MNNLTRLGVKILMQLFFDELKKDEYLAMASMELQFDVGIFNDRNLVSQVIEEEQAFALLPKLQLLDVRLVEDIHRRLMGVY